MGGRSLTSPTQPVTTSPTDWPPPSGFPRSGRIRVNRALPRGNARKGGQEMLSFYDESRAGSAVLIRDPLAGDLVGSFSRHGNARGSSIRAGFPRPARSTAGKSSVTFWRRVVAFALTVTRAVRRLRERLIGLSSPEEAEPRVWMSTSKPTRASAAPAAGISDRAMRRPNPKRSWNTSSIRYGTHGPS